MKTSLNKSKRKKGSMTKPKETTIHDVEGMILERLNILQNGETKEQKRKARSEIIKLERHLRDVNNKYQNGHKYPERLKGLPDDKPMNFKELEKLIDSVPNGDEISRDYLIEHPIEDKNLQGLMINKS